MESGITNVKAQVLGLKELPTQTGPWGKLLPRPGEAAIDSPQDWGAIKNINPEILQFVRPENDVSLGYGVFLGGAFCVAWLLSLPGFLLSGFESGTAMIHVLSFALAFTALHGIAAAWAYFSARAAYPPPVLLSRTQRKFYYWAGRKIGWQTLDYDKVHPFTSMARIVTPAGSSSPHFLTFAELEEGTRTITRKLSPGVIFIRSGPTGQLWEFIRRYMDGPPEQVPPIPYRPPVDDKRATLARFDQDHFAMVIDQGAYRINRGFFAPFYFWFWGSFEYWQLQAMAWVQRTAPRVPWPAELHAAQDWQGENPYRVTPPNEIQQAAFEGRLPHLKRRWMIAAIAGGILHGSWFVGLILMAWVD